jgi:hypothetical protein
MMLNKVIALVIEIFGEEYTPHDWAVIRLTGKLLQVIITI